MPQKRNRQKLKTISLKKEGKKIKLPKIGGKNFKRKKSLKYNLLV